MLTALAMANMSIPDTSTMNQISATILTLTKEADELTPESQVGIISCGFNLKFRSRVQSLWNLGGCFNDAP